MNLICTTGIFESGDLVQQRWRDLRRRGLALFLYTGRRAGKCSKCFNRFTRTARKTYQIASVLRCTMDHNRRSDIRRKWVSRISVSISGDNLLFCVWFGFYITLSLLFHGKTIRRVLFRFPTSFFGHLAYCLT